jgi:hypothetical protein
MALNIYGVALNDRPTTDTALAETLSAIWAEAHAAVCGFHVRSLKATASQGDKKTIANI